MPLPKYVSQARPQMTNQQWQTMPRQRRQNINRQTRRNLNQAAAAAPAPAPATAPSGGSGPYTPPQAATSGAIVDNPFGYSGTVPQSGDYANHPFFDPSNSYLVNGPRGAIQQPSQSKVNPNNITGQQYLSEENPEGYYLALMNKMGLGGFDARSQTAQGLYNDYQRGWRAAQTVTPDLWFPEYMGGQNVQGQIGNMSYNQLGIDPNQWSDRSRWGMRGY